jgi:hypothetical protein
MSGPYTILNVSGPYREPREPVFSYDYSVQRPAWITPHSVRVKVGIHEELDLFRAKVLSLTGGSPGQQLKVSQLLSRKIADRKLEIANQEGLFSERRDVMVGIFTGPLTHLLPPLEAWMRESAQAVRGEIQSTVGI